MEKRNQFSYDGQELEQDDVQAIVDNGAFADDHVFAELLRMVPLAPGGGDSPARGIMPWAWSGARDAAFPLKSSLIAPNGASGSVLVSPFRAFVGSRTLEAADALKNLRDIRSALSVASGSTTLTQVASFAANASGNPRWDLVVAAVTVDANATTVTRYVKDTTDDNATPQTVVTQVQSTVTLQVVTGTAGASPTPPATPADTSSIYYIPLAWVRIPNGFGATSTVLATDVATIAPLVGLNAKASGGGMLVEPADSAYGGLLTTFAFGAGIGAWGSSGTRPPAFMPSTSRGGFIKELALDFSAGAHSIQPDQGGVIDASRDWRNRRFMILATFGLQSASKSFPWEPGATSDTLGTTGPGRPIGVSNAQRNQAWIASSSHIADTAGLNTYGAAHSTIVMLIGGGEFTALPVGAELDLLVDQTNGNLVASYGGSPVGRFHIFVIATGQYENA